MAVYSEETIAFSVGQGIDMYNNPSRLREGFCVQANNFIAKEDRLVSRPALHPPRSITGLGGFSNYIDTTSVLATSRDCWAVRLPETGKDGMPVVMWSEAQPDSGDWHCWGVRGYSGISPDYDEEHIQRLGPASSPYNIINGQFMGACIYLDKLYANFDGDIFEINIDWDAGTYGSVQESAIYENGNLRGLFAFKDRLWAWTSDKIYYTDVPDGPGQYPETWDDGNFIVINANAGLGRIYRILPVGTQLFVFTTGGLYTISVLGSPINWVVRLIDNRCRVNSINCAIEYNGLVIYITYDGVWATDGSTPKELSKNIRPAFDKSPIDRQRYEYSIAECMDGILISMHGYTDASTGTSSAEWYYTPLEYIAWTTWTLGLSITQAGLIAGFPRLSTYTQWNHSDFLLIVHNILGANPRQVELKQLIQHQKDIHADNGTTYEADIVCLYLSEVNVYKILEHKRALRGYLNLTANDSGLSVQYLYVLDNGYRFLPQEEDAITSVFDNLWRIQGPEFFRHVQLYVEFAHTATVNYYEFMGAALDVQTHRKTVKNT